MIQQRQFWVIRSTWIRLGLLVLSVFISVCLHAQTVKVRGSFDDSSLVVGSSSMFRVFAEVDSSYTNAAQIVSWYLDVRNLSPGIAVADYNQIAVSTSDNLTGLSSSGSTSENNRIGIYNTLVESPGAGVTGEIELLSVPVTALSPGTFSMTVVPGSGVDGLIHDFQVSTMNGGNALIGGIYNEASAQLSVLAMEILDTDGDGMPDAWEELHFNSSTGAVATVDSDDDGMPNLNEFLADTDPRSEDSVFAIRIIAPNQVELSSTSTNRSYEIYAADPATPESYSSVSARRNGMGGNLVYTLGFPSTGRFFQGRVFYP